MVGGGEGPRSDTTKIVPKGASFSPLSHSHCPPFYFLFDDFALNFYYYFIIDY